MITQEKKGESRFMSKGVCISSRLQAIRNRATCIYWACSYSVAYTFLCNVATFTCTYLIKFWEIKTAL